MNFFEFPLRVPIFGVSIPSLDSLQLPLILKTVFLSWAIYLIASCIYSRYFHPLSRFPGPFAASITNFWKLYICITKKAHTKGIEYHARYGRVVRVAPNLLVFDDPKLLPKVYHRYADKSDFYSAGILGRVTPPFQTKDHKEHTAKRKRIAASFQMSNLKKLESDVDRSIAQLTDSFQKKFVETGQDIDISQWVKWFVYDTVSHMAFGRQIGFVENGKDVEGLIQSFHDMAPMAGLVAAIPNIVNPLLESSLTRWYLMPTPGDGSGTGKIMQYRDNMLKERLANRHSQTHADFLDNIMNAKNSDGSYMTVEEIKVEALVLMVAAADTSAAFIGPFINNVIQNPGIHSRLRQEIQEFESQGKLASGVVAYDQAQQLPYFQACIKESLRYSPSTPFIMPRVVSKEGMNINGIYVPEGTEIGANPYVVHRDKEVFGHDAFEFNPDRWLESEERTKEMDKYILSWGYGPRICLGKNIAQMMTQKLCLELFRRFEFRCRTPDKPWREENLAIMIYWDQWLSIDAVKTAKVELG